SGAVAGTSFVLPAGTLAPGSYTAVVTATNGVAPDATAPEPFTIPAGKPTILSTLGNPLVVTQGTPVAFSGAASGAAPLVEAWIVRSAPDGSLVANLPGSDVVWDTTYVNPGDYEISFIASNSLGDATSAPIAVTVDGPTWFLGVDGFESGDT